MPAARSVIGRTARSDVQITRLWWLSLGVSGVVVAVVAALLGAIVRAARSIDGHATDMDGRKG